jgi:hypothetical protein
MFTYEKQKKKKKKKEEKKEVIKATFHPLELQNEL